VRVLLGRVLAGAGQTARAREVLEETIETASDASLRELAETELASLGAPPASRTGGTEGAA
jgi:predicted negative regulator of RcsB-dependent stress response